MELQGWRPGVTEHAWFTLHAGIASIIPLDAAVGGYWDMVWLKVPKLPPQKTIMDILSAHPVSVDHTGMFDRVSQAIQDSKTPMEAQRE
ncbi:hypothetical protein NDU88_006131 [Pleurodeles waltl]|uniref:Uncharacterized protein n=1 Tax=Pleurodeles waltl TaxID=8319 RepID=A0AAV7RPE3_PLEWA|nr:hypothetical protein NDU88_006131 [Pleurodeles waltl]